jgi:outer membrane protein TolC
MAGEFVSIEKYLERVRLENRALRANAHSLEAAFYGVLASVAYQRPSLSSGIEGSYLTGQQSISMERNITSSNADVRLSLRIDVNGAYTLDEQQQILSYENQRALFDDSLNTLLSTAEETYWSAVIARENIALQKDVLRQRRENLRITQEKYKQQMIPKLDVVRAEAQVVAAESFVSRAESRYRNALETMSGLAGGLRASPAEEPLTVPVLDRIAGLEKVVLSRPDIRAERLALERSRIVKKLTAKGLSPFLEIGVAFTPFADPRNSSSPQSGEAAASLRMNIPITDGNETKYKILNSDKLVLVEENRLESAKDSAVTEFAIAFNNWEDASVLEKDKKRQVERSDEELALTELLYTEGMGAQIDLLNAQTDNQQVRTEYLNAVGEMYVAMVALKKAAGDYAPDGQGTWKDAVIRYGRGDSVSQLLLRSEAEKAERMKKAKSEITRQKKGRAKH